MIGQIGIKLIVQYRLIQPSYQTVPNHTSVIYWTLRGYHISSQSPRKRTSLRMVGGDLVVTTFQGLTRFNKVAIPNNKFLMASGQGSHWLIESPTTSHLCVARPYQISVNYIFKHIHTTSINTIIWQFVPFIYHPL